MSFWRGELLKVIAELKQKQPLNAALTSWGAVVRAAGFDAFAATPSSANLRSLLTDETGTGAAVFANAPTITGVPVFSGIPSLTGGALSFPATQVPSAGANDLDDYEENTWTPTLTFATPGNLAVTYTQRIGTYTKIGRLVILRFNVLTASYSQTTASGDIQITGNPFTNSATGANFGILTFSGITKATYTQFVSRIGVSTATLNFQASGSGVAQLSVVAADVPTGGTILLSGTILFEV